MPDVDHGAAEPPADGGAGIVYPSAAGRRNRRRRQALAGAGLAAVLGAGALAVAHQYTQDERTAAIDVGAPANVPTPVAADDLATAPAAPSATRSGGPRKPAAAPPASASPSAKPKTIGRRPAQAPTATAKAGTTPRQPPAPRPTVTTGSAAGADAVTEEVTGDVRTDGHSLRVVSARRDLSGSPELRQVADKGQKVGDALCSQTFRVSNSAEAEEKPKLLVCWRTSATKSVVTVAVDIKDRPSKQVSVAAIDKAWAKLG